MTQATRQSIGQFIEAELLPRLPKHKSDRWHIYPKSGGCYIGVVSWFGAWRQYVFDPAPNTTYSAGCLDDIAKFLRTCGK